MPDPSGPFQSTCPLQLVGGKGGVGKTTLAAAIALHRATTGSGRVLLLSTDPAHSLRDSLAGHALPKTLDVDEFASEPALDAFRNAHRATLHEIVDRGTLFDDADIERLLDLSLPGLDEVMAFLRLADLLAKDDPPTIVVDTAPTGHTLRLLDMPEQFTRWIDVLDVSLDKHRHMRSVFGSGAPDALDAFVEDMHDRARRVRAAFRDAARCRFCVVTQAEPVVLVETRFLLRRLQDADLPVGDVVVNQWAAPGTHRRTGQCQALRRAQAWLVDVDLWTVPAFPREVRGLDRLRDVASALSPFTDADCPAADAPPADDEGRSDAPAVRVAASLPNVELLFVAGKGGVGKTTIATATALRCADGHAPARAPVLLLSTDPAHSLSAALQRRLTNEPTAVANGLHACEINAQARFNALREAYAHEVRRFFDRAGGSNIDLTYDRPVMERLMDLAPPGVDEIMGLTATMDFLDANAYATCVLDTAPTGHLVRLLEMPSVFEAWIRAFFRILQKYRSVLHLPELSDRLVTLSKQVKALRRRMQTPGGAALLGVTLPTEMAAAETDDLSAHAQRLGLPLALMVVNRVAGPSAPPGQRAAHASVLNRYRRRYAGTPCAVVQDGPPPRGPSALRTLGRRLYPNAS
jgi:arsenite-transporting ATPase